MSDSFADLWSSSAAIPQKTKPQTLASASSSSIHNSTRGISKPFSLLASTTTQHQQPRYGSPNSTSAKRSTTGTPVPSLSVTPSRGTATAVDAFSDLFSSTASLATGPSNINVKSQTGMTIAERLAMEAEVRDSRRFGGEHQLRTDVGSQDSTWVGLDSLVHSGTGNPQLSSERSRISGTVNNLDEGDDWVLSGFTTSMSQAATSTTVRSTLSQPHPPSSSRPSSRSKSQQQNSTKKLDSSVLDFGITSQDDPGNESRVGTGLIDLDNEVADFNFDLGKQREGLSVGNREINDDDDILGMLSQPVEVVKAQTQTQKLSPSPTVSSFDDPPSTDMRSGFPSASSPPPHVLGHIVEMGFSIEQAKKALANTKDGMDIQAALETLLGNSGGIEARREVSSNRWVVEEPEPELQTPVRRGPPKGFRERERERLERMRRERDRENEPGIPPGGSDVVSDMQEQADKLLSQASEIGLSVLSKASAFWKGKREQVVKVYEERATTITGQKERADSGPRWMKEGVVGSLMDEDDLKAKKRRITRTTHEPEQRIPQQDTLNSEVDLFSAGPSEAASIHEISAPPSQVAVAETATNLFPLPTRDRPLPTISPSSLSAVDRHRSEASSQFKLGQYASAIESYSVAINILPPGHLLLLPLFNNRALARMRTGEYKAAAADAARALGIVLVNCDYAVAADEFDPNAKEIAMQVTINSWRPSMESPLLLAAAQKKANSGGWTHPQGFGVDLVDGYEKALRRRAEACEGRECWSEALKLWEVLSAGDSALIKEHLRKEAQRSAARCRKMITDETFASKTGDEAPNFKPKPPDAKPTPIPVTTTAPSAAVRSLQASNAQAEAEDNLKLQLKDTVDAKLVAWRTGKETNIRALLASLDMILWDELLRGIRVGGLHELVTPIQVKKGYMKAIARVHPDKLNTQNSTVEQRMVANAVFGTLSEAWTTFQSSNGM